MKKLLLGAICCLLSISIIAQDKKEKSPLSESTFNGLKLRSVGPAFVSGRIADIAIHPEDDATWYVAVGSGGVWKTENAGTTWKPIFDDQASYSTGCITIDPNNPHTIWLGTGENVGGRHVAYGDGVYVSKDGGASWKNMGLKKSEHISKILVHPSNSDVIWVAAQGPLWSKGDERGLYKSTDGGATWKKTLGDAEWTGVTDIVMDPRNPDQLYAATWQRHRTIAALMGGGPNSGIHRSTDGGETWEELKSGIPSGKKGKIGLAISPQQPDVIYAAIELNRTKGGVFRSTNRGSSWTKMSDAVSGATGPHYYQELYASPHAFDRLYLMDVRIQVSDNGGKTFRRLKEEHKHSDNHAIAFRADDPDYLLIGTDAGIYESHDLAENWRYIDNMPITQYYKVAVDDKEPFYHIYGGTQDNGSHGGPSRTDNSVGIRNGDWYKTLGADGHQSATEPGNPNIIYAETQQGGLHRVDKLSGDQVYIQPQAGEGEPFERYNWDAPIVVSPHNPAHLYFASQRVWYSEDRGDSWTALSTDLTRNQERITLPIMGKVQSWDSPWDVGAMSNFNTITSLGVSPVEKGIIYAGTDDGIVQVTENHGESWRKIEVGRISGVPSTAFVNDIKADLHDANTVYMALDNHKYGDFKPYLVKSTNRGRTWTSIANNIPDRTLVWRIVQDHVEPNLLFAATEFGIYFSVNGGGKWTKLSGAPTIAFRDLAIQKRENDLVGASFGRSFYVLDDYSFLREVSEDKLSEDAALFATRKAWWYNQRYAVSGIGANDYVAENPDFGAVFTYYLKDSFTSATAARKKKEKELEKANKDIPFPGWDALDAEGEEEKMEILLVVKDQENNIVRSIPGKTGKGIHRTAWDLRYASKRNIGLNDSGRGGWRSRGFLASPGTYTVTLVKRINGETTELAGPQSFEVVPLRKGALKGASIAEREAFRKEIEALQSDVGATNYTMENSMKRVTAMQKALARSEQSSPELYQQLRQAKMDLKAIQKEMYGSPAKDEIGERNDPTVQSRMRTGYRALSNTYGPTDTHRNTLAIAKKQLVGVKEKLSTVSSLMPQLEQTLRALGAPWIEGQPLPKE